MKRTKKPEQSKAKGKTKPTNIKRTKGTKGTKKTKVKIPKNPQKTPKEEPIKKRPVGRPRTRSDIVLSEREQCFADLILDNMHRSSKKKLPNYQCYLKAFPHVTAASAKVMAHTLLKKETVKEYIQARKRAAAKRVELNVEMVLRGLLRIALFDPRKLYKENGQIKRIIDLDDDTALGIHGIKYSNIILGKGSKRKVKTVIDSVQTESRKAAWELLGTHLNMWVGSESTTPEEFVTDVRSFANSVQNAVPGGKI